MPRNLKCAPLWIAAALAVVTLAVYWPVTGFQFLDFDDCFFVTSNPQVQAGLTVEGFQWAWRNEVAGNWHPITVLSHMLDCQLFGVKPWWPHLVNVLLHAANTVLLFGLLRRMTGALWRSAIVAALFALHPLHVESVAWVAERKDVLSTLFWFLTTWAYVRYADPPSPGLRRASKFYGLSLVFFALGLMCKPMVVTLPLTLLLLDYWPLKRIREWRLVGEKIPFFALSAALCVVTFQIQKLGGGMKSLQDFPLGGRAGNALLSYLGYIEKMFWPRHLAGLYLARTSTGRWWGVTLAALLLLAVCGLVVAQMRRRPYLAVGWFWYLGTLVPVIGLVQVGAQAMADRYTYVPLIGLFVMVVWGGWELAGVWRLGRFAQGATAAALAACAALTVHQEFYWENSETLFKRMIDVTTNNYVAHYNLADYYLRANRPQEALSNFMAAIEENPECVQAHNNLGGMLTRQQRYDEAIEEFRAAVRYGPSYVYCMNLANALVDTAAARHDTNACAEAIPIYQQALRIKPNASDGHHNLGLALQTEGRASEALAQFEQAARLDSNRADTWTQIGMCCASQNRMAEAERAFRELVRLQPGNADACCWLGNALGAQNKLAEAIPFYLTALKLDPADFRAEYNFARTLSALGKREDSAEHYRQALRINPNFVEAQKALSAMESAAGAPNGGAR